MVGVALRGLITGAAQQYIKDDDTKIAMDMKAKQRIQKLEDEKEMAKYKYDLKQEASKQSAKSDAESLMASFPGLNIAKDGSLESQEYTPQFMAAVNATVQEKGVAPAAELLLRGDEFKVKRTEDKQALAQAEFQETVQIAFPDLDTDKLFDPLIKAFNDTNVSLNPIAGRSIKRKPEVENLYREIMTTEAGEKRVADTGKTSLYGIPLAGSVIGLLGARNKVLDVQEEVEEGMATPEDLARALKSFEEADRTMASATQSENFDFTKYKGMFPKEVLSKINKIVRDNPNKFKGLLSDLPSVPNKAKKEAAEAKDNTATPTLNKEGIDKPKSSQYNVGDVIGYEDSPSKKAIITSIGTDGTPRLKLLTEEEAKSYARTGRL